MKTALLVLPEIPDSTFMLVGEYLVEKGFVVLTCCYNLSDFRQQILNGNIDYTFINYGDKDIFEEITCFSKITHPRNQFIVKLNSMSFDLSSLIQLNVSGYFSDTFTFQDILLCLNNLEKGKKYISGQVKKWITKKTTRFDLNLSILTHTERKIFTKLASGNKLSEIADELFISIHTLNNHKTNIRKKLKLKSNRELIFKAMELKYSQVI
jgi:DNA-binding NarL/FixJ family response regulator